MLLHLSNWFYLNNVAIIKYAFQDLIQSVYGSLGDTSKLY